MDVANFIEKMKQFNWGDFISFMQPVTASSLFGAFVTMLMRTLKVIREKDEKFTRGFFFQLVFEAFACTLFGIILGALATNFTENDMTVWAAASMGGMFGEKIYKRFSHKIEKADSLTDLDPTDFDGFEKKK